MSKQSRREAEAVLAGEVKYHGRYLSRREIFERIQASREWRGAVPYENETHWGLLLGTAHIAILKAPPPSPPYMHGRQP